MGSAWSLILLVSVDAATLLLSGFILFRFDHIGYVQLYMYILYIIIRFHYLSVIFISLRVSGINLYHVLLHLQHHHWLVFALQQVIWKTKIELWKFPIEFFPLFYI